MAVQIPVNAVPAAMKHQKKIRASRLMEYQP